MTTLCPDKLSLSFGCNTQNLHTIGKSTSDLKPCQNEPSQYKTAELSYIFEALKDSSNINEFEHRVEKLRDLLLNDFTALSEQEMFILVGIFTKGTKAKPIYLIALASLLEPLIENSAYSSEIKLIVTILLKSHKSVLRYAALDIISYGLGVAPIATELLKDAQELLANDECLYISEYLESL